MNANNLGAIALMVKTPGFSRLKTRLAAGIGSHSAQSFHRESACAVASIMRSTAQILGIQPFFAIAESDAVNSPFWQGLPNLYQGEGGLGLRMHQVYSQLQRSHGHVILLGADTPQMEIGDLVSAAQWISKSGETRFSFGPAQDGGFWLFGGNGPIPQSLWTDVEYSQPDTGKRFLSNLSPHGKLQFQRTLSDVDTVADLPRVLADLTSLAAPTKEQAKLILLVQEILSDGFRKSE